MIKRLDDRKPEIVLTGPDGNAYCLLGYARQWAKQLGLDPEEIIAEMKDGDYEHLVEVLEKYFGDYIVMYR